MSNTTASLRKQIDGASDLQSVVRTMKAVAASSIGQYESAVQSLSEYYSTVQLGLSVCLRSSLQFPSQQHGSEASDIYQRDENAVIDAVVFGSDQGLVGQFNDIVVDFFVNWFGAKPKNMRVWAIGQRVQSRLVDEGFEVAGMFAVPGSVKAIANLVGQILIDIQGQDDQSGKKELCLYHNKPSAGSVYEPVGQRLLPLDEAWCSELMNLSWPTGNIPQVIGASTKALRLLIREHLFVSLFRSCAESLASENASRLAAMQRADKNIDELLETLNATFYRLRQSGIDEELFDVISGFDALDKPRR